MILEKRDRVVLKMLVDERCEGLMKVVELVLRERFEMNCGTGRLRPSSRVRVSGPTLKKS